MSIQLVTDEKIAETSSKGNQEKWLDGGRWYKLDQFGYEALAESFTSSLLEYSSIERDTGFTFARYRMERMMVHGRELYGGQLKLPRFTLNELKELLRPMLDYYSSRDRGIITDRITETVLTRQRMN